MQTLFKNDKSRPSTFTNINTNTQNQAPAPVREGDISFFPGGIYLDKKLNVEDSHKKALDKLVAGRTKSVNLEKIHHKFEIYSIRVNDKARILGICAPCVHKNNQSALFVFAFYDNHQYGDLKFKNFTHLKHPVIDLEDDSLITDIINEAIVGIPKDKWRKAHYLDKQAICFSDEQELTSKRTHSMPVIVTGSAGSGKTLIIVKILCDQLANLTSDTERKHYIYIAPTAHLAEKVQKIFTEYLQQNNLEHTVQYHRVLFMSLGQFLSDYKPEHQTLTQKKDLEHWLTKSRFDDKFNPLLGNIDYLIEEFKMAAVKSQEEYVALGKDQSLYDNTKHKALCYELFDLYKKKNPKSCQYLFPELREEKPKFDMVLIDEIQNFTIKQALVATDTAINGQFIVFGDPLQNLINRISIFSALKQRLHDYYQQKEPLINLENTYRNPQPVIELVNGVALLRRQMSGGVEEDFETRRLKPATLSLSNDAPVEWITKLTDAKIKELKHTFSQPDTMIITLNEAHLKLARDKFGQEPLILLADFMQGLDAKKVFVYLLFTKETIKKINNHLKTLDLTKEPNHKPGMNSLGTPEFNLDMYKFLTALTRVKKLQGELTVYLGDDLEHSGNLFIQEVKKHLSNEALPVKTKDSTPIDIKTEAKWIKEIYHEGLKDEAKKRYVMHINKDGSGFEDWVEGKKTPVVSTQPVSQPKKTCNTPLISKKSTTNTPRAAKKVQNTSETKPVNAAKSTPQGSILKLLENFSLQKLATFFRDKEAKNYLFLPYKPHNSKQEKTLFETLINNPGYLEVLNQVLLDNPFAAEVIVESHLKTITIIKQSLPLAKFNQCSALYQLLDQTVEQVPAFMSAFSDEFLAVILQQNSVQSPSYLNLLHKLVFFNPVSFVGAVKLNQKTKPNHDWCIQLLKSSQGCGILTELYRHYAALFTPFALKVMEQKIVKNEPNETPLFFWLTTRTEGQRLFKELIVKFPKIKNAITIDVLLHRLNNEEYGPNMLFWLLHGEPTSDILGVLREGNAKLQGLDQSIITQKYKHPDYPGQFILGGELQRFVKDACAKGVRSMDDDVFIPAVVLPKFMPYNSPKFFHPTNNELKLLDVVYNTNSSPKQVEADLLTLLKSKNAESLLFDYSIFAQDLSLFDALFKNDDHYAIFISLFQKHPELCQLFTIQRLNQFQFTEEAFQSVFISIVMCRKSTSLLQLLLKENPELATAIHKHKLLYSPICVLGSGETKTLLPSLRRDPQFVSCLSMINEKSQLTPKFFQYFCDSDENQKSSTPQYRLSLFEHLVNLNQELLHFWLEIQPKFTRYLDIEHFIRGDETHLERVLDTRLNTYVVVNKEKTTFHKLLSSTHGFKFLVEVLKSREDLLKKLSIVVLSARTSCDNSPLFRLSLSNEGCELLLSLLKSNENNIKKITPENLFEFDLQGNKQTTLNNLKQHPKGLKVLALLDTNPALKKLVALTRLAPSKPQTIPIEVVRKPRENPEKFDLATYLKPLLTHFDAVNLAKILKYKNADEIVFKKALLRSSQEESLFEIILDKPDFLEAFIATLKADEFLATGALIDDSQHITRLIKKIKENTPQVEQHLSLFDLVISNQPNLMLSVDRDLLNDKFLYQLSINKNGLSALSTIVNNYPNSLEHLIEQANPIEACWFSALLESHLGCSILACLYELDNKVTQCINIKTLAKKSLGCIEGQTPIYFWLASTIIGQDILYKLLKEQPELLLAIPEHTLTQTISHPDALYDKTNTLFWLTRGLDESDSVLHLLTRAKLITPELLNRNLVHPKYLQSIITPNTRLDSANSYKQKILVAFCPMPKDYTTDCWGHSAWNNGELELVYQVVDAIDTEDYKVLKYRIKKVLAHKNVESLLFDQMDIEDRNLCMRIITDEEARDIFRKVLEQSPSYYRLFTLKRLNQLGWTRFEETPTIIQHLINEAPDILEAILKNQESIRNSFTAEALIKNYGTFKDYYAQTHLLSALADANDFKILEQLNPSVFLQPALIAELFKIKPTSLNVYGQEGELFSFAELFIKCSELLIQWIQVQPNLLNYFKEEHLFAKTWLKNFAGSEFCNILSLKPLGVFILLQLIEKKPQLFKALSLEQLVSYKPNYNSMLYFLSTTLDGTNFLAKLVKNHPQIVENLHPSHLEEKYMTPRGDIVITLDYLVHNGGFTVLAHCVGLPNFKNDFNPQVLFRNQNKLIYDACDQADGIRFLAKALEVYPQMAAFFTKDLLCKPTDKLPHRKSFFLACIKEGDRDGDGKNLLYAIIKNNPSLLGLTLAEVEQLSRDRVCKKIAMLQLEYKGTLLNDMSQIILRNWALEGDEIQENHGSLGPRL